jgi:hypothetical protein
MNHWMKLGLLTSNLASLKNVGVRSLAVLCVTGTHNEIWDSIFEGQAHVSWGESSLGSRSSYTFFLPTDRMHHCSFITSLSSDPSKATTSCTESLVPPEPPTPLVIWEKRDPTLCLPELFLALHTIMSVEVREWRTVEECTWLLQMNLNYFFGILQKTRDHNEMHNTHT